MALADPLQLVVIAIVALLALTFADGVVYPLFKSGISRRQRQATLTGDT